MNLINSLSLVALHANASRVFNKLSAMDVIDDRSRVAKNLDQTLGNDMQVDYHEDQHVNNDIDLSSNQYTTFDYSYTPYSSSRNPTVTQGNPTSSIVAFDRGTGYTNSTLPTTGQEKAPHLSAQEQQAAFDRIETQKLTPEQVAQVAANTIQAVGRAEKAAGSSSNSSSLWDDFLGLPWYEQAVIGVLGVFALAPAALVEGGIALAGLGAAELVGEVAVGAEVVGAAEAVGEFGAFEEFAGAAGGLEVDSGAAAFVNEEGALFDVSNGSEIADVHWGGEIKENYLGTYENMEPWGQWGPEMESSVAPKNPVSGVPVTLSNPQSQGYRFNGRGQFYDTPLNVPQGAPQPRSIAQAQEYATGNFNSRAINETYDRFFSGSNYATMDEYSRNRGIFTNYVQRAHQGSSTSAMVETANRLLTEQSSGVAWQLW